MKTVRTILTEMLAIMQNIDSQQYSNLVSVFSKDHRFFFSGEGRSGLIGKAIAMRLMHSGKAVFVIGETTTPAICQGDQLVVLSGSAKTASTLHIIASAKKVGAKVFLITTNQEALQTTAGLCLPAATKYRLPEEPKTIQPLGNQFDQAAHLLLDAAIIDSLSELQTNEALTRKHANLE